MASNRIVVHVIGDVSSLERAYAKASASTVAFNGVLTSQNRHLLQASRGALIGSGALAGLTRAVVFASSAFVGAYGLAYALKTSADAAKDFQAQMELISTQAGGTQREVEKMSKAILNIAPSLGQTPTDLAKGLYHLESAGFRGAVGIKALTAAAKGAAVGQADLEDTVNALVGAYKSGIGGVGSFQHAVATLSAVVGAGNIRMNDLNQALGTGILPAARAFGLTFEDVGAALATLSIGSVPVVEAATRLRMSFSLLSAGSVKADKALATIGLTTKQLAVDMRQGGIGKAIGDLKDHLDKLSPVDQVRLLQKAFGGGRFSTSIITLVQNLDLLKQRLHQVETGASKFGASFEHTRHTAEFASKEFHAATQVLAVELGATLLPSITKTETSFAHYIEKLHKSGELQKDIKEGAHDVSIIVSGMGKAFHLAEGPIVTFTNALGGVGKALRDLLIIFAAFKLKNAGFFSAATAEADKAKAAMLPTRTVPPTSASIVPNRLSRAGSTVYGPSGPAILGGNQEAMSAETAYAASVKMGKNTGNAIAAAFDKEVAPELTAQAKRMVAIEKMQMQDMAMFGGGMGLRSASGKFAGSVSPGISEGGAGVLLERSPEAAAAASLAMSQVVKEVTPAIEAESTHALVTAEQKTMAAIERMVMEETMAFGGGTVLRHQAGATGLISKVGREEEVGKLVQGPIPASMPGKIAGVVKPAFSTGGEEVLLSKKSGEAAEGMGKAARAATSFGSTLGRSLTGLSNWAMKNSAMAGLGLAFLGPTLAEKAGLGKGVGSVLGGAGFGLLAGGMLPGKYSGPLGMAAGAGIALHNQGGQLGRTAGDVVTGAGTGALLGQPFGPWGMGIGAAVGGLSGAFLSLRHHTESASAALDRLSKTIPGARANVAEAKTGLAEAKGQVRIDIRTRDQAKQALTEARSNAVATRGTKDHKVAVDALRAAEAEYAGTIRQIARDEKEVVTQEHRLSSARKTVTHNNKEIAHSFDRVSKSIRLVGSNINPQDKELAKQFRVERIKEFDQAMDRLGKKGPVMAQIAAMLKRIADETGRIPPKKEINIIVNYVLGKRLKGDASHQPEGFQIGMRDRPAKKAPKKDEPPKVTPPHDFVLPPSVQLDLAKASTESSKKQLEADKAALAYVKKQIASGKLTKKGLIDAYNEVASLQGDIESLTKKAKSPATKLSEILPTRFTSRIQKAVAQVSVAEVSGIPSQQINALEKLQSVYQKALMYLKSEHETGAKRLLQIKEEAALTGKIADVRKQIGALIAQAVDAARQSLGQLFQGPVLAPTQQQQNAMLGVPNVGAGSLTKDLRGQTAQFARFEHDLQILQKRGASKQLISELRAQGPSALPQVEALAKSSKATLEAFFKAFAAREKLVRRVAKIELHAGIVNLKAAHLNVTGPRHSHPSSVRQHGHEPRTKHHHPHHVPHMAKGGVVDKPTLVMIGEAGKEAVIPLPRNFNFQTMGKNYDSIPHPAKSEIDSMPHLAEGGIVEKPTVALIGEKGREAVIPLPRHFAFPDMGKGHDAVVRMLVKIEHTLMRILSSLKHHGGSVGTGESMGGISVPPITIGGAPNVHATLLSAHHIERIPPSAHEQGPGVRELIINLDGREVGRGLLPHHQRQARGGVAQVRGRHYGHNLALS